jgi:peptidoglycan hydrolase-like protein with peptidoglycan-binding domain
MDIHVTLTLPVLSKGAKSGTVARLQEMLNVFVGHGEEGSGIHPLKIDAVFGTETEQKVMHFQKFAEGAPLAMDGKVGQATWTKLLTMWLSGNAPG